MEGKVPHEFKPAILVMKWIFSFPCIFCFVLSSQLHFSDLAHKWLQNRFEDFYEGSHI